MFPGRLFRPQYLSLLQHGLEEVAGKSPSKVRLLSVVCRQIRLRVIQIARLSSIPISGVTVASVVFTKAAPQHTKMTEGLETILQNADQLFDENHYQEVIDVLANYSDQNSPEIMWRKSRAYYSLAKAVKNKAERDQLIRDSYELIRTALEADELNFAIHKWMAIILDANAELDGIKSRISQLENVKKHMDRAAELKADDPTNWYLLGSYEFGLADMSWVQRKVVSAIFASPPTGSYENALKYFEQAEKIKPGFFSLNWLMLGKCHLALKNPTEAKVFLEKAANCRVLNEDDKKSKEEATQLLKKL